MAYFITMEVRREAYAAAERQGRQGRQGRDSHRFSLNFLNLGGEILVSCRYPLVN